LNFSNLRLFKSLATLLGVIALGGIFWFLRVKNATVYAHAAPERILAGIAHLPFQYRILTSLIVKLIQFCGYMGNPRIVFGWIDIVSTIGVFVMVSVLMRSYRIPLWGFFIFFVIVMANYVYLSPVNYMEPYDMPAILIFSAGIQSLYFRRFGWFYGLLFIGMLNRETASLLTCAFILVEYDRLSRPSLLQHVAAQALIIITVKAVLYFIYRKNGGLPVELFVQQGPFIAPDPLPSHFVQNIGYLWSGTILPLFGGVWLVLGSTVWFIEDRVLRRLMWLIPIEFGFMMVVGRMLEFRLFNECVPLVALGATAGISGLISRRRAT
jgi:hypothetical protein